MGIHKISMKPFPYKITIQWSAEDNCYLAEVPVFRYCLAHGDTPEEAAKEVVIAASAIIDCMIEDGKDLPEL